MCMLLWQRAEEPLPSSAYLYNGAPPPPPKATADPSNEEALMASMGLPTSLRAFTAAVNNDDYEVLRRHLASPPATTP